MQMQKETQMFPGARSLDFEQVLAALTQLTKRTGFRPKSLRFICDMLNQVYQEIRIGTNNFCILVCCDCVTRKTEQKLYTLLQNKRGRWFRAPPHRSFEN